MSQATTWKMQSSAPASPTDVAARINDSLDALLSGHSGSTRPAYAVPGTIWNDDSVSGSIYLYFYDGAEDIPIGIIDTTENRYTEAAQAWVDVATASTVDLAEVRSRHIRLTGTTTVTSFGSGANGTPRKCRAVGAFQITASANIITPTGGNITTAAGDTFEVVSLGSGVWLIFNYQRASGAPLLSAFNMKEAIAEQTITAGGLITITHSLGAKVAGVSLKLKCVTGELGYSTGDEEFIGSGLTISGTASRGCMPYTQSSDETTKLYIRYGSDANTFNLLNKSTGTVGNITNANWKLIGVIWA